MQRAQPCGSSLCRIFMLWTSVTLQLMPIRGAPAPAHAPPPPWPLGGKARDPPNRPEICSPNPYAGATTATSMSASGNMLKCYHNIYYHNKKWFGMVDSNAWRKGRAIRHASSSGSTHPHGSGGNTGIDRGMSVNTEVVLLPSSDLKAFAGNLQVCYVPGVTLRLDFPFSAFPDNLGYWGEILLPLFSALSHPGWLDSVRGEHKHINRIMLGNVQKHMFDWPEQVLTIGVAPASDNPEELPLVLEEKELHDWCRSGWVVFENLLVVQDRYPIAQMPQRETPSRPPGDTGPHWQSPWVVGFQSSEQAMQFQLEAYRRQQWPLPKTLAASIQGGSSSSSSSTGLHPEGIPRVVTVMLYPEGYPPLTNHYELVRMLEELTEPLGFKVRTVSLTMEAPFVSHLATVAATGLLVARHGPILASATLLPPGAAVLELLPYKWEWRNISSLYYNMTQSTGAIHHWAWRPSDARWCRYKEAPDSRFANWTAEECRGKLCLLAHARAGLEVDLAAVRKLLEAKLPLMLQGRPVQELSEEWPPAL